MTVNTNRACGGVGGDSAKRRTHQPQHGHRLVLQQQSLSRRQLGQHVVGIVCQLGKHTT